MGEQKTKKEILFEKINELNHKIEEYRRSGKDCSQLRIELTQLIIELDNLGREKEGYEG